MDELLLDSRPRLEGSDEIGSVCPSFRPSFCLYVSFLRIGLAGFFRKNPHRAEMTKNGPKRWFLENQVISFVWNLCKMKVLMVHRHSAQTAC